MATYALRRALHGIMVVFFVTVFVFFALRAVPGDVVRLQLADASGVTEAQIAARTAELGLDKPVLTQLFVFLGNAVTGDFGQSFQDQQNVMSLIGDRLPITLQLGVMALLIGVLLGVPIGMLRSSLLEVMQSNFVRTVRARGASNGTVLLKHATRNSLVPVFTVMGLQVGHILGGTVILESIFSIPGMGSLIFESVQMRDYPVVLGCVVVYGAVFVFVNIVVDLMYAVIDPRVRYQ